MYLLEDRGGSLDIAAVSSAPANPGFVAATPKSANVGFSASAWWVRVTCAIRGNASRFVYLRQDYPLIDSLDLYEPDAGGGGTYTPRATARPSARRDVAHRDFLFPLTVPASSDVTYYLRYHSQGPIDINLSLLDPNS